MIPIDKQLHFFVGGTIMGFCAAAFGIGIGIGAVVLIAAGKEIYDYMHRDVHTPDIWDFIATLLGGIFVWIGFLLGT
jgi:hypothetical protein